jgi:hypothetical protein
VELVWEGLHFTHGRAQYGSANIDIADQTGIATIDVVEINRPSGEDYGEIETTPRRNGATTLDVRVGRTCVHA